MNTPTCDVVGGPLSTNSGTFSQSRWAKAETQVLVRLIPLISEPSGFDTGISTNGMSNKILSKLVLRARGSELFFLLKKCCSSSVVAIQIWQKFCQVLKDKTGRHEQIWRFWHYEIKVWIKDNKKLAPSSDISCPSCPPPRNIDNHSEMHLVNLVISSALFVLSWGSNVNFKTRTSDLRVFVAFISLVGWTQESLPFEWTVNFPNVSPNRKDRHRLGSEEILAFK